MNYKHLYSYKLSIISHDNFVNSYNSLIRQLYVNANTTNLTQIDKHNLHVITSILNSYNPNISSERIEKINTIKFSYSSKPSLHITFNSKNSLGVRIENDNIYMSYCLVTETL